MVTENTMTVKAVADTVEEAFAQAQKDLPEYASILEKRAIVDPSSKTVTIEAFDSLAASRHAESLATSEFGETATVKKMTMALLGRKGFLGIGKKPHQYEAELLRRAAVEIDYRIIPPNVEELRSAGDVEGLSRALNYREDKAICQAALKALSEMGNAKHAVETLRKMRGAHVVKLLGQVLEESGPDERLLAIEALARNRRSSTAAQLIVAALADRSSRVSEQATKSLESMGASALRHLIVALKHKKDNVRKSAINALGKIGDQQAVDALKKALGDKAPDVRKEVPMALGNSAALLRMQRGGSVIPISQVAGTLVSALEKGDPATRDEIVMTLVLLSGEDYGFNVMQWKLWQQRLGDMVMNEIGRRLT